ncbi:MAG: hypothetical protein D6815_00625 [Candidatus Dadabacteria bacterium]|nr:MAG: hypothetical protein D6815_00625 [Candidatus Dadabacteria bacterium]
MPALASRGDAVRDGNIAPVNRKVHVAEATIRPIMDPNSSGTRRRMRWRWVRSPAVGMAVVLAAMVVVAGCHGKRDEGPPPARRVVILGFDGVDPDFLEQWSSELPHVRKLMTAGTFRRLATTVPPASCTAWSSFATGINPGGHGIFDFIYRDPKTYLPDRTGAVSHKAEYLWNLFERKPETFTTTMTGVPFWKRVDEAALRSVVLRVPCVYPLIEAEHGHLEGGFGVPDIRGTEGTFHFYTTELTPAEAADPKWGGKVVSIGRGEEIRSIIEGPINPLSDKGERLTAEVVFRPRGADSVEVEVDGRKHTLQLGRWGDWFRVSFRVTPFSTIHGLARFRLVSLEPELRIYLSPINHDPADPAIAVTEPPEYATELYEAVGDYKTVGWNHETWGLNEERIGEDAFMEDVFDTMRKTEEITFHEFDTRPAELFVSVFVEPDRTSHMMYRLIDENHPLYDPRLAAKYGDAIRQTYRRMDEIIGKMMSRLGPDDTLFVISDHGFHSYRRGFNVNTWLIEQGYMALKGGKKSTDKKFFLDVDWAHTKAYAMGVGGIYLNIRGREAQGIVEPGEPARRLAREIAAKLEKVVDPKTGERAIHRVYLAGETWKGPRLPEAQDLQIGFAEGYRVSSATPLGGAPAGLFEDNMKKWSGDHAASVMSETKGIFLSNRSIKEQDVRIVDLAPTALDLLGVPVPADYEGRVLTIEDGGTGR